jgi:predicted esterase
MRGRLSLAAAAALLLFCNAPAPAQPPALPKDPDAWKAALVVLTPSPQSYNILSNFARLDFRVSFDILKSCWGRMQSPQIKHDLLDVFARQQPGHQDPFILKIIHMGATDPSLQVQNEALSLVQPFAFRNFATDYAAYLDWSARHVDQDPDTATRESLREVAAQLNRARGADFVRIAKELTFPDLGYPSFSGSYSTDSDIYARRRKMVDDAGILPALAKSLKPENETDVIVAALQPLRLLRTSEAFQRQSILPLIDPNEPRDVRIQALGIAATPENKWLAPILVKQLLETFPDPPGFDLLQPLATIADPSVIPTLVAMVLDGDTRDGTVNIGYVIGQMVGLPWDGSRDAAWWRTWWERNHMRFDQPGREAVLPKVTVRKRAVAVNIAPRIAFAVQTQLHHLPGDPMHAIGNDSGQSYVLVVPPGIQPGTGDPHDSDPGLIVVLPGGDGNGVTVTPFWTEVEEHAFKGRYIVALAVAPPHSPDQPSAWTTRSEAAKSHTPGPTAEQFADAIARSVVKEYRIRPDRVFLHGVSDSGPAVYSASVDEETPFRGFYILSSKFSSTQLPPLKPAKGRRYLIQHSQDDRVAPYWMAEAAQKLLLAQGAVVRLLPYQGNHGYNFQDDPFANIAKAVAWLEGPSPAKTGSKPAPHRP